MTRARPSTCLHRCPICKSKRYQLTLFDEGFTRCARCGYINKKGSVEI